jgi:hypothetical protein
MTLFVASEVTVAYAHDQYVCLRAAPCDCLFNRYAVRTFSELLSSVGLPMRGEQARPAHDVADTKRSKVHALSLQVDDVDVGPGVQVLGYQDYA